MHSRAMSAFRGSASGLSKQRLRARGYVQLSRDLYVVRGDDEKDLRTRTDAALLVFPDAVPCLQTAALLQQLPVDDDGLVHLARGSKAARSERSGLKIHRMPVEADELLELKGITVADGPRTFVDLAATLSLEGLVAVGDVVLRRYDGGALRAAVDRRVRRPGLGLARRALPLLDAARTRPPRRARGFVCTQPALPR